MAEREKVIRALEWCIKKPCHPNCPYFTVEDESQARCLFTKILPDALDLLKEKEARVIYTTEIQLDIVYWMEKRNIMQPWPVAFIRLYGNPDKLVYEDYYGEKWTISGYRVGEKGWRCWTSRPTEEQRKAVKWDD